MLLLINALSLLLLAVIALQAIIFSILILVPTITVLNAAYAACSAFMRGRLAPFANIRRFTRSLT